MPEEDQRNHPSPPINDPVEWNEKPYGEGHWARSSIPPLYKHSRGKFLGASFLLFGIPALIIGILGLLPSANTLPLDFFPSTNHLLKASLTGLLGLLWSIAGIRLILRKPPRDSKAS